MSFAGPVSIRLSSGKNTLISLWGDNTFLILLPVVWSSVDLVTFSTRDEHAFHHPGQCIWFRQEYVIQEDLVK